MGEFYADLRDVRFVLFEQLGVQGLADTARYGDFDKETMNDLLQTGFDFAKQVIAPSNQEGDEVGSKIVDGQVYMPEVFKTVLKEWGDNGFTGLIENPEYGGMGAPLVLMSNPQSLLATLALHRRTFGGALIKVVVSTADVEILSDSLASRLYRLGLKGIDQAVFQTDEQAATGTRNFGIPGRVIPTFLPDAATSRPDGPRDIDVLWVGGCDANKRPELLLDLAESLPEARFVMISAPRTDRRQYEQVRARAARLPNVEHLGFVLEEDSSEPFWNQIAPYHRRARLLVSTSRLEGFPNVFLEAWSAGAPVVSLNVDPDGIIQRHALGCRSGTMEQLTADVAGLLDSEARREALAANGRAYVARTHATEVVVRKYLDMFEDLKGRTG